MTFTLSGPDNWHTVEPVEYNSCAGEEQSPIDIKEDDAIHHIDVDMDKNPLKLTNYDKEYPNEVWSMANNGHSGM